MCGMGSDPGMTELRRGVLGPCVLALLDERPRFGLEGSSASLPPRAAC